MPSPPALFITGQPEWAAFVQALALEPACAIRYLDTRQRYISRLVEEGAALILVDGTGDWTFWTATPRASPATRRIPVVLVSDDDSVRTHALKSGVDFAIRPADIPERLPELWRDHRYARDAEVIGQLADQCAGPLPDEARRAIDLFNRGEYYRQHDLLEALWMDDLRPVRDLYQAILQVGIGYYQVTRGNRRGAIKMLLRASRWLDRLPDRCQGVDIARLRRDASDVRAALEAWPEDRALDDFDRALLRPVMLLED